MNLPIALDWIGDAATGRLRLLDQRKLPGSETWLELQRVPDVHRAIKDLVVRGAPAIGVTAAYACVLAAREGGQALASGAELLKTARPTAVNLAWACDRMKKFAGQPLENILAEARAIHEEDRQMCRRIGEWSKHLIPAGGGVLTHCNAGALATGGIGTATAPIYLAWEEGKRFRVYADETRPVLQGARLTAWELARAGVDVTLICDGAAATLMREKKIDLVIVGADRIARNGDVANKIGTYGVALLARAHDIPFYVAAPGSTIDPNTPTGEKIPIEQRPEDEVRRLAGTRIAPDEAKVYNPAFDVTPAELIAGIITDKGLKKPGNWE